ncbi:MAG TPA: type II secretion system minor pseudopilin GspH [Woeseiaceae bacterium]|nr:type II secretion system minor pseudopilin GspH [Woeseiaceae bacterium]
MIAAARDRQIAARKLGGFTLIELLVVVVIIGIVSSFLLLSFGILGNDRALDQQIRRLASLLELTLDEATLQGRDFGLELMQGGYRFVELDPVLGQWGEVVGDDMLQPRQLDEDMEIELYIEGRKVLLSKDPAKTASPEDDRMVRSDREKAYAPHVLILSSGDLSPFRMAIVRDTDRARKTLSVSPAGEIEIDADDQAAK